MNGPSHPSPLNLDFDDSPFGGGNFAGGTAYQPLGASLDAFFLGPPGGGVSHGVQEDKMDIDEQEQPSFLAGSLAPNNAVLDEAEALFRQQTAAVDSIYQRQRSLFQAGAARNLLEDLRREQLLCLDGLKRVEENVNKQLRIVVMSESEVHRSFTLLDSVKFLRCRLTVAAVELGQRLEDRAYIAQVPFALFVLRQPFPCVYTKGKAVEEDELQVQFVSSPCSECTLKGPIECSLEMDPIAEAKAKGSKKGGSDALSSNKAPFGANGVASPRPKFELGSRKTVAFMQFNAQVSFKGQVGNVSSEKTNPTIVITNESQWEGSEGILLKSTIFANAKEVPWAFFANVLQRHFLIVTRQDLDSPSRPLSRAELAFFQVNLLGGKQVVDAKAFGVFWEWYGKCAQVLRYQRHIGSLWNAGLLLGFVSRQDVNNALHGREPGTFLVRFSERHAGQFAVAYVGYEMPRSVKHYLVQPTDTASAKKTLPDFLSEIHQFQKILELKHGPNGPVLQEVVKDDAFSGYLSRVDKIDPGAGYDQLNFSNFK